MVGGGGMRAPKALSSVATRDCHLFQVPGKHRTLLIPELRDDDRLHAPRHARDHEHARSSVSVYRRTAGTRTIRVRDRPAADLAIDHSTAYPDALRCGVAGRGNKGSWLD
jgi:hypothetical protein